MFSRELRRATYRAGGDRLARKSGGRTASPTGVDRRIRREFVEIGGLHIRNVVLTPYQDELLAGSVGEEVAISVVGPRPDRAGQKAVIGIRTSRGTYRFGLLAMTVGTVWGLVLHVLAGVIAGGLAYGILTATVSKALGVVVGLAIFVLANRGFLVHNVRAWKARSALDTAPAPATTDAASAVASGSAATPAETKTCPQCAEEVKTAAVVCRFCGHRFDDALGFPSAVRP